MNRREFLKTAVTIAALAPVANLAAKESPVNKDRISRGTGPQVTRRNFKNTAMSLPLLGFGMMRLPMKDGHIDKESAQNMVDRAMSCGVNYFDTAYMYHRGESEPFVGEALAKYPRESYYITSKMPVNMLKSEADIARIFDEQLKKTRAGYFDFYFMHWLNDAHWEIAKRFNVLDFMEKKQADGKIRYLGFSYHGEPEKLAEIAKTYPWDLVQIQLNYQDWELYRSREQYDILTKLGIPVAIMEPLKGGTLVHLNDASRKVLTDANPKISIASWGLRFAASLPNVLVVLSGMSAPDQLEDNLKTFTPMTPLIDPERSKLAEALAVYRKSGAIPCTVCRYCSPCPVGVDIPYNLALHNQIKDGLPVFQAKIINTALKKEERASNCVSCGACSKKCPQKIDIPSFMKQIAKALK